MARLPRRMVWPGVVLSIVVAAALTLWRTGVGDPLSDAAEARLLDLRFAIRGAAAVPEDIVIVAIDDATVDALGWMPPPRLAIAEAIETLREAGPAVIAVDLLFLEQSAAGPRLAAAIAAGGDVVVAVASAGRGLHVVAEDGLSAEQIAAFERSTFDVVVGAVPTGMPETGLLIPDPALLGGATLGHVNIARSGDRVARMVPLALWIGGDQFLPALSLEAVRRLQGLSTTDVVLWPGRAVRLGAHEIGTDPSGGVVLNHYGPSATIPTLSLLDIIEGRVAAGALRGKAVFIGATAESLSDQFATPFGPDVPGVEILATLAGNLVDRGPLRRDASSALATLVLGTLGAGGVAAAALGMRRRGLLVAVPLVWAAALAALQAAFAGPGLWLDATAVIVALGFATLWGLGRRLRWQRAMSAGLGAQRDNLSRFFSPRLAGRLAEGGAAAFAERSADAAVLFVDVAGFTTLSEIRTPAETTAFLRDLHRLFQASADRRDGVVISYEGDGALLAFGIDADDAGAGAATNALRCGLDLLDGANALGPVAGAGGGEALRLRVSIHHGPVSVAVVGGETHAQLTVTGDTVNVASRLQDIAKSSGRRLVVSAACRNAALADAPELAARTSRVGRFPIRGRRQDLEVWGIE
ncbi:adenylate/guanylate cyclase domain-containing protein [Limibaculum sp. M0105]|uniref:Adenylate/guanylate cyclase domain-containing protein n=1 Tax=Thermohalobaculum xanthum TaxID=2753746 RepID=A0A8J7SAF8_9RHOB|nr:adenylate/guanylate cyclase domain-containing protein [Thermohalobaculum xanthum]MBK0398297.1 adenylate/guanylate cyclase domain-containing protein [Thermohalobaculum xanthum]